MPRGRYEGGIQRKGPQLHGCSPPKQGREAPQRGHTEEAPAAHQLPAEEQRRVDRSGGDLGQHRRGRCARNPEPCPEHEHGVHQHVQQVREGGDAERSHGVHDTAEGRKAHRREQRRREGEGPNAEVGQGVGLCRRPGCQHEPQGQRRAEAQQRRTCNAHGSREEGGLADAPPRLALVPRGSGLSDQGRHDRWQEGDDPEDRAEDLVGSTLPGQGQGIAHTAHPVGVHCTHKRQDEQVRR
mmetsp:Transcript_39203/g.124616  ORF Transcript_39203/g.124616 Transcript_39203/m.124616 type:complete len:240 (+) Transcript_39203:719-1438(+)